MNIEEKSVSHPLEFLKTILTRPPFVLLKTKKHPNPAKSRPPRLPGTAPAEVGVGGGRVKSAEKSAETLKNFPSSSPEVTTKNNDSQIGRRLSGVSASTSSDQDEVPCPGGRREEAGGDQARSP